MQTLYFKTVLFSMIFCFSLLQGCISHSEIKLTKKNFESINKIKVVRYRTPNIEVKTASGATLRILGGVLTGPLGAYIDESKSEEARKGIMLPDYGDLLMRRFVERAGKEIPNWPEMVVEAKPVIKGYTYKDGHTILIDLSHVWVTFGVGLHMEGWITMNNPAGDIIYKRLFYYRSKDFNLTKSIDEYLADNCKLLREEMPIAADYNAKDLVKYIRVEQE